MSVAAQGRADITRVVPPAYENAEGNGQTVLPFGATVPMRIMYAYGRSAAGFDRPVTIEGIRFRPNGGPASGVAVTYSFTLEVSTGRNPASALDPQFDANHGADRTIVKGGGMQLAAQSLSANPNPFVLHIWFGKAFEWDPKMGPLLLDFHYLSGSTPSGLSWDAATTTGEDVGRIADLNSSIAQFATFQGGATQNLGLIAELCIRPLVVPDGYHNTIGLTSASYPFAAANPLRLMTIYGADTMPFAGRHRINALSFRPVHGFAFPGQTYDLEVTLSTSSVQPSAISTVYDSNHGSDRSIVFDGIHVAPPLASHPAPGPYAVVLPLSTPFEYDPNHGNLVVDIRLRNSPPTAGLPPFDAVSGKNAWSIQNLTSSSPTIAGSPPAQYGHIVGLVSEAAATIPEAGDLSFGTYSVYPFNHSTPHRVMQLYESPDFDSNRSFFIQHLRWRPHDFGTGGSFGPVTYTCTIDLSLRSTGLGPLSPTFASNFLLGTKRVFDGTFSVPYVEDVGDPAYFPISVKLDTPYEFIAAEFPYDLVVDIRMLAINGATASCDGKRNTVGVWRQVNYSDPNAAVANYPAGGGPDHFALTMSVHGEDPNALSENYGSGCVGSNGTPGCATTSLPVLPNPNFTVRLNKGPTTTFAIVLLGVTQTGLSLDPFGMTGCTKLSGTELGLFAALTNSAGVAELAIPLPAMLGADGFVFTTQWAALDVGANQAGIVLSDAQRHTAKFR